jgi:Holliday junction resolvasome RuvABC endonuclease subunit
MNDVPVNQVIMCLDLALANTGVAVLSVSPGIKDQLLHVQTIHTEKSKKLKVSEDEWRRTQELVNGLQELIKQYNPIHVFIECPTGGSKSASAARSMAVSRGATCACLLSAKKPATLISPFEAKAAATGHKLAEKSDVKAAVLKEFPNFQGWITGKRGQIVEGLNEHVYDALSVYMAARNTKPYKELKNDYSNPRLESKARPIKRKHNIRPTAES